LALGLTFIAWTGLRLVGIASEGPARVQPRAVPDDRLPIYTIIVALYREAAAVKDLVAALRRLAYPPEKLDIKFVIEADDRTTRAAIGMLRLAAPFEIIVAPRAGPRTKPKALNA